MSLNLLDLSHIDYILTTVLIYHKTSLKTLREVNIESDPISYSMQYKRFFYPGKL